MQDVAQRLGVSTGLIHYHFDYKDALLAAAFEHAAERDLRRLEREVGPTATPVAKLAVGIRLYAPKGAEPGWMLWIDAWGEALRNPILRRISQDLDIAWKTSSRTSSPTASPRARSCAPIPTPPRGASRRWSTVSPCR